MEQRSELRHPTEFSLAYTGDLFTGSGTVHDLSTAGCGISASSGVHPGAQLYLMLFPPEEDAPLRVELGVVRWATDQAFGVEFLFISGEQQRRLRKYLQFLQKR